MSGHTSRPDSVSLERLIGTPRLAVYIAECNGAREAGLDLYEWNAACSAALWEPLGHLEVALRNAMHHVLETRHRDKRRPGEWLQMPWLSSSSCELSSYAVKDLKRARKRSLDKGKDGSTSQVLSELSFGFWRFLVAQQYASTLWPDLVGAFPHSPNRSLTTVESPLSRLHEFRNRLAHHQPIWNHDPNDRYGDLLTLARYIHPDLQVWIGSTSRFRAVHAQDPR